MAAEETAWLSCRGPARFASWQPGMPSGEAAWLPAPKLGFASWQGVMASGEARGGPPLGPGPGPVDVGVQESWPTGAGGSMKRRRLSWPWAVGRQCVTRVGSGRVGFRVAGACWIRLFNQLSALNPQLVGFVHLVRSTLNPQLVGCGSTRWHTGRGPGEVASVGGEGWRGPEGRRTAPTQAGRVAAGSSPVGRGGWAVEGRWRTGGRGRGRIGPSRRSSPVGSSPVGGEGHCHGSVRKRLAPGPEGAAPRLGFCPRVGKGGSQE